MCMVDYAVVPCGADRFKPFRRCLSMRLFGIRPVKRASFPDALVVLGRVLTNDCRLFHLNAKVFGDKVDRSQDRQIGIPLAAAWSADLPDGTQ